MLCCRLANVDVSGCLQYGTFKNNRDGNITLLALEIPMSTAWLSTLSRGKESMAYLLLENMVCCRKQQVRVAVRTGGVVPCISIAQSKMSVPPDIVSKAPTVVTTPLFEILRACKMGSIVSATNTTRHKL